MSTNIKRLLKENPQHIVVMVLVLILTYFCVLNNFDTKENISSEVYTESADVLSTNLVSGDVIEQEFVLEEGDDGLSILFATYMMSVNYGTIDVDILDSKGEVVYEEALPAADLQDNSYFRVLFDEVAEELQGQRCTLRLTILDMGNQPIAVYASNADLEDCSFKVNGVEQTHDLVLRRVQIVSTSVIYKDLRLFFIYTIAVLMIYVIAYRRIFVYNKIREILSGLIALTKQNKKPIGLFLLFLILGIILACMLEGFIFAGTGDMQPARIYFMVAIYTIALYSILFQVDLQKNAHVYFFVVMMLVGAVSIVSLGTNFGCWDEHIHYARTQYMSLGGKDNNTTWMNDFAYLNTSVPAANEVVLQLTSVGYIPTSIVLYLCRVLNLGLVATVVIGKMTNLFLYTLFFALAIYCVKGRGKLLLSVLAFIPTSLFMATCYSYDWWVIALTALGCSIVIGEVQAKGYVTTKKLILGMAVAVIGMLPKPIYFPVLFPLMLLKREQYQESKKSRWIVVLTMVVLVASFILPMVLSGPGEGDLRGGSDVNSTEQIKFILGNVVGYIQILLNFLWEYLNPEFAYKYLISFSYVGKANYYTLCMMVISAAVVLDNTKKVVAQKNIPWIRFGAILGALGGIVLAATSMYVSFTPVGLDTINGCQARYILPVLFPFLFFIGEFDMQISDKTKSKAFMFLTLIMAFVFMNGWYDLIISQL